MYVLVLPDLSIVNGGYPELFVDSSQSHIDGVKEWRTHPIETSYMECDKGS